MGGSLGGTGSQRQRRTAAVLVAVLFLSGVLAAGARSLQPAGRPLRAASVAPPISADMTTPSADATTTTASVPETPPPTTGRPATRPPQTTAAAAPRQANSSTTTTSAPHAVPAACAKPPGVGSGPYVD